MRFFVIVALCLFAQIGQAQENAYPYDLFGNPKKVLKVISSDNKSTVNNQTVFFACDDKRLLEGLNSVVSIDSKIQKDESIIAYRHRLLAQRYIQSFSSLSLGEFEYAPNNIISEILISEKINKNLQDNDFALCVGDNPVLKRRIYLLQQYNSDDEILVHVVGYDINKIYKFICKK